MRLPTEISPAARARRALLFDALAALLLTVIAVLLSAGIGIVGFVGLLVAIFLIAWIVVEKIGLALLRRRRPRAEEGSSKGLPG